MHVGVLGPLRVERAGREIDIPGRLPRRLLATMVARNGDSCSMSLLSAALWGEEPPPSAVKTLQAYVARLRALLGTRAVVTTAGGYMLNLAPRSIDAVLFAGLIIRAGHELIGDHPHDALSALDDAFELWRGEPYEEFTDLDVGVAEHQRLTELRLLGCEHRIDALLASGRELEAVAEAETLCRTHPLREHFWYQLMLALYRDRRQADALLAFQRMRRFLADDLGVDPSIELQELQRQILRQDPSLYPRTPAITPAHQGIAVDADDWAQRRVGTILVARMGPANDAKSWGDPERIGVYVRQFREVCSEVLDVTGGVVTGHTESSVTAAFGVLAGHDDHAERALDAALDIRTLCSQRLKNIVAHIGVASGELIGRAAQSNVTTSGEPVQLADVLSHMAIANQILVNQRSRALAEWRFAFIPSQPEDAGIACAPLVGHHSQRSTRTHAGLATTFVGRADELQMLRNTYDRVVRLRRPHLLSVIGEPGIGKSTLVARFVDELRHTNHAALTVHVGRCLPYGAGASYAPLAEVLRQHLKIPTDAGLDEIRDRLRGQAALGPTFGLETAGHEDPKVARTRLHNAWIDLVGDMCSTAPTVLLIEDVHWAQLPLLDMINDLLGDTPGPLLLVTTARPHQPREGFWDTSPGERTQTLRLGQLNGEQATLMIKKLLGESTDQTASNAVLARAGGNPFFIEELLAALIDGGAIALTPDGWRLTDTPTDALPDTVRAALTVRLSRLSSSALATLQTAAVIGDVFATDLLAKLSHLSTTDLDDLAVGDLIRPQGRSRAQFAFKHALVRQVAYDLLPLTRRTRLHVDCADILAASEDFVDKSATLAHHYATGADPAHADVAWSGEAAELARVRESAVTWLRQAASQAGRQYAVDEALQLLHRALAFDPPRATQARLWFDIAQTHGLRLDNAETWAASQRGIDLCDDRQTKCDMYAEMAMAAFSWGSVVTTPPPVETILGWLNQAVELGHPDSPSYTSALMLRAIWQGGLAPLANDMLARAERSQDVAALGQAYNVQAAVAQDEHRYEVALAWYSKIIALYESQLLADPHATDYAYQYPIPLLITLGRFDEARQFARRNQAAAERRSPELLAHAVSWRVEIETLAAEWQRVAEFEDRVVQAIRETGDRAPISTIRALLFCTAARLHLGHLGKAAELEQLAARIGHEADERINGPWLTVALAQRDLSNLRRLFAHSHRDLQPYAGWWSLQHAAARLEALSALGQSEVLKTEAALYQPIEPYLAAVAARALGNLHRDTNQLRAAANAFTAMSLPAQARLTNLITFGTEDQALKVLA